MKSSTDRCCRRREQSNYKCPAVGCSRSRCKAPLYRSRSVLRLGKIGPAPDRKSTRLNSSHLVISYAVFCLKKKRMRNILLFMIKDHSLLARSHVVCGDDQPVLHIQTHIAYPPPCAAFTTVAPLMHHPFHS